MYQLDIDLVQLRVKLFVLGLKLRSQELVEIRWIALGGLFEGAFFVHELARVQVEVVIQYD